MNVWDHLGADLAAAFEDTEYRHFTSSATTAFAFTDTTKTGLIDFDLAFRWRGDIKLLSDDFA